MRGNIADWLPAPFRTVPPGSPEEEADFITFCGDLTRRLTLFAAALILLCTVLWWPLDAFVLPPGHAPFFFDLRLRMAGVEGLALLLVGLGRPERQASRWLSTSLYLAFLAVVGYSLGELGSSGVPWLANALLGLIPSALLPMPFPTRVTTNLLLALALATPYFLGFPENLHAPFAAGQLSFLCFTVFFSVMVGESNYRQTRRGYFEQKSLADANGRLARLTDSLQEIVATRTQELRALALHLDEAQEGERKRIARDLHDNLGQELTAMRYTVARLEDRLKKRPEEAGPLVEDLGALVAAATQTVRGFVSTLRPRILEDLGLVAAAEWLCDQCRRASGLECTLEVEPALLEVPLDGETSLVVFRVLQEATTNALKHASPRRIDLRLGLEGDTLVGTVSDDGRGFDPLAPRAGFGLRGLEERVLAGGGQLGVRSAPGAGTTLSLRLPIPRRKE